MGGIEEVYVPVPADSRKREHDPAVARTRQMLERNNFSRQGIMIMRGLMGEETAVEIWRRL